MSPLWERLQGFDVEVLTRRRPRRRDDARRPCASVARGLRVIVLQTVKGNGLSFMEGRMESHYLPLTAEQYEQALVEMDGAVVA